MHIQFLYLLLNPAAMLLKERHVSSFVCPGDGKEPAVLGPKQDFDIYLFYIQKCVNLHVLFAHEYSTFRKKKPIFSVLILLQLHF